MPTDQMNWWSYNDDKTVAHFNLVRQQIQGMLSIVSTEAWRSFQFEEHRVSKRFMYDFAPPPQTKQAKFPLLN
jgi:hypothetical protein